MWQQPAKSPNRRIAINFLLTKETVNNSNRTEQNRIQRNTIQNNIEQNQFEIDDENDTKEFNNCNHH